jgi:hypothetical protein
MSNIYLAYKWQGKYQNDLYSKRNNFAHSRYSGTILATLTERKGVAGEQNKICYVFAFDWFLPLHLKLAHLGQLLAL